MLAETESSLLQTRLVNNYRRETLTSLLLPALNHLSVGCFQYVLIVIFHVSSNEFQKRKKKQRKEMSLVVDNGRVRTYAAEANR